MIFRLHDSLQGLTRSGGTMKSLYSLLLIFFLFLIAGTASGETKAIKPKPGDKCPVCGMFVAKYPDFVAEVIFKDGSYVVFDGAKDMFKYYQNMNKHTRKVANDIGAVYVTDYYSLELVDGRTAYYVVGSDVHGPMGRELIPFGKRADAEEFRRDHKGRAILRFNEVTPAVIKGLD